MQGSSVQLGSRTTEPSTLLSADSTLTNPPVPSSPAAPPGPAIRKRRPLTHAPVAAEVIAATTDPGTSKDEAVSREEAGTEAAPPPPAAAADVTPPRPERRRRIACPAAGEGKISPALVFTMPSPLKKISPQNGGGTAGGAQAQIPEKAPDGNDLKASEGGTGPQEAKPGPSPEVWKIFVARVGWDGQA